MKDDVCVPWETTETLTVFTSCLCCPQVALKNQLIQFDLTSQEYMMSPAVIPTTWATQCCWLATALKKAKTTGSSKTGQSQPAKAFLLYLCICFNRSFCSFVSSWGSSWGEGGYMRMVRDGRNTCGIASYALYPILWFCSQSCWTLHWSVSGLTAVSSHTVCNFS